ncbi:MAG TPA: HAMP domain-containing sensor histidine kinase [Bradyrhizobium sp.]|nr:HAMP domain-containing sensor histidine kinase [Bradyrhizobium sp.]
MPIRPKWRPTLGLIVFAVLSTVIALPLVGLFFFRIYDNQLIHQTQAELIAQSSVLSAVYAREVEAKIPGIPLGLEIAPELRPDPSDRFAPIRPALDLAGNDLVARRPDARPAQAAPDPAYLEIGARMLPVMMQTQKVTLAGFRILDPHGTVIAGRRETGMSLAHIEEVAAALQGRYRGALRVRISDKPPPPIYSISRGTGLRVFSAMPVIVDNHVAGVIYASRTPSNIFRHFYEEKGKFVLAVIAVLGVTLIIGLIFSRTITRPMHELIQRISEIRQGKPDAFRPLSHYGTREFALLSRSFLEMAETLSHRSDHISTFAAHLTHELKSPLTSIRGAAELLQDSASPGGLTEPERKKFLDNILGDTERIEVLVRRLRELAQAEAAQAGGSVMLQSLVGELRSRFPGLAIEADGALDRSIGMSAENALIVLSHLADNAGRHHATELKLTASDEANAVRVVVSNNGDAISAANRDRIFDAFFTTRRDSGGTGMGLSIAQAMLRANGGSIRLLPQQQGTAFEVRFRAG